MSKHITIIAGAIFFVAVVLMIGLTVLVFRNSAAQLGPIGVDIVSPADHSAAASPTDKSNFAPPAAEANNEATMENSSTTDRFPSDSLQNTAQAGTSTSSTASKHAKSIAPKSSAQSANKLTRQQKLDIAQYAIGILQGESSSEIITQTAVLIENVNGKGKIITSLYLNDPRFKSVYRWRCTFFAKSPREFTAEAKLEEYHQLRKLAVFSISHENLPTAIDWRKRVNINVGDKLLAFGCRSELTAQITRNDYPIVTESTDVRFIPSGTLEYGGEISLSSKFQPEMYGGPVLDDEDDLVGILAITHSNENNGKMLTVHGIQQLLSARARNIAILNTWQTADQRGYTLSFSVNNSDNAIKKAQLIGFEGEHFANPNEDGTWNLIAKPSAFSHQFEINETDTRFQFSMPHFMGEMDTQLLLTLRDGTEWCSPPMRLAKKKIEIGAFSDTALAQDRESVTLLKLAGVYSTFCHNAARGDIAALNPFQQSIDLFKASDLAARDLTKPIVLNLDKLPISILLKHWQGKDHYVVSYDSSHQIDVFEADTLKFVKNFEISVEGAIVLASSQYDNDPIVYYIGGGSYALGNLQAFDLTSQIDLGDVVKGSFRDVAFSEANSSLFLAGHASELSRVSVNRSSPADRPKYGYPDNLKIGGNLIQLDPNGKLVGADSYVYSLEKKQTVGRLNGTIGCFLRDTPIVLSYSADSFRAYSTETFEPVGKELKLLDLSTPQDTTTRIDSPEGFQKSIPLRPAVLADEANKRIIVAKGSTLLLVPYEAFEMPSAIPDPKTTNSESR